jgi:nucleoside-diphosphate-sugar epimerase
MKVIITGATGMVGEGVLLECLADPAVERVLSVSRRPCGHTPPSSASARAMLYCARVGATKTVLEAKDIQELAKRAATV